MESFVPLNAAPVGGRRRSSKKLKVVTRKQARKLLKSMGRKMRGGSDQLGGIVETSSETAAPVGGRRRRGTKKTRRGKNRTVFGMKLPRY